MISHVITAVDVDPSSNETGLEAAAAAAAAAAAEVATAGLHPAGGGGAYLMTAEPTGSVMWCCLLLVGWVDGWKDKWMDGRGRSCLKFL
jgi:hypothetical protein